MKKIILALAILLFFAESVRFSMLYSKIESHVIMLIASRKAFEVKSKSLIHDSAVSVIFNSNLNALKSRSRAFDGSLAYRLVLLVNKDRRDGFLPIEATYLDGGSPTH